MTIDKSIIIKNIYHMLAYAFQVLRQTNFDSVGIEEFESVRDLFAAILTKGVSQLIKQGLYKEYITVNDSLYVLRGKLDINNTIANRIRRSQKLACEFDELSENNTYNQIIKTTLGLLINDSTVKPAHRDELRKLLVYFDGIDTLTPTEINWNCLHYHRNNRNYEMVINICYLAIDSLLLSTEKGEYKTAAFTDDNMAKLFEHFILEYYRHHHPQLNARASQVAWDLTDETNESMIRFLPVMQTDIFLHKGEKTLIIDAKYYTHSMQSQYDKNTLRSNHMYQIFTYVKNQDKHNTGLVSGILLYAKTDEELTPDFIYSIGGNKIGAKTLDLNCDFKQITCQLDNIVSRFF